VAQEIDRLVGRLLRELEPFLLSSDQPQPVKVDPEAGQVQAARFTNDAGRHCVIAAGIGPGESRAVLRTEPGMKLKSRFGLTNLLDAGSWRFEGNDICADIMEEK